MRIGSKALLCLLCAALALSAGCADQQAWVITVDEPEKETVVFFAPIARGNESVQGSALPAFERAMRAFSDGTPQAELQYKSYTQQDCRDKDYDQVCLERVRGHMGDDVLLLNPDVVQALYPEGYLCDLAELEAARAMTDAARQQCTIDGRVVSVPMTMIAYCLFVNVDLLEAHGLTVPNTAEEFLYCCQVLKKNGITPLAGNRWWLENFVLTQGLAPLYLEEGTREKIAALNSGETPISGYLRPGFEFLAELMKQEYFDVDFASKAEAGDERELFLQQEAAFVIHYDGAVDESVYGSHSFDMAIIGFPTDAYGQVNLMNASHRICINSETDQPELAVRLVETMCSREAVADIVKENGGFPSRSDVEPTRIPALKQVYANVDAGRVIPGQNPDILVEQWGNTCQLVQKLLAGESVEEVLRRGDALQRETVEARP